MCEEGKNWIERERDGEDRREEGKYENGRTEGIRRDMKGKCM